QDDKGWDARKRAYCLKIQPATGSFARNLIYSTKPSTGVIFAKRESCRQINSMAFSARLAIFFSGKLI
ncbi:hypothetical protein, partial [Klebsiella pneumoniae]|uniref:hypothetical protein n=1 Tax=Klebsiella pneumoniae TaxID=573 RepID=UPI001D0EB229